MNVTTPIDVELRVHIDGNAQSFIAEANLTEWKAGGPGSLEQLSFFDPADASKYKEIVNEQESAEARSQQKFDEVLGAAKDSIGAFNTWSPMISRIVSIAITLLLVQILMKMFQYNVRLAAFFDGRADAFNLFLALKLPINEKTDLISLMSNLTPDNYDFDKMSKSQLEQVADLASSMAGRLKSGS